MNGTILLGRSSGPGNDRGEEPVGDLDDVDLDIVIELTRRALGRIDGLSAQERRVMEAHGRPAVAMLDGIQEMDVQALRAHLAELGDSRDIVGIILGDDDASALAAVERARALRLGRVWGRDHPGDDS